MKAGKNDNRF